MFKFIKKYWFAIIMAVCSILYLVVFLLVLFSPKTDKLNRGFIPCTTEMARSILEEREKGSFELVKIIIKNTYCDAKVVGNGLVKWVKGEQSSPWANYLFEPVPVFEEENAELAEFYEKKPDAEEEMKFLNMKRLELEKKLMEAEIKEDATTDMPLNIDNYDIEDGDNEEGDEEKQDEQEITENNE